MAIQIDSPAYQSPTCSVTYGVVGHVDPNQVPQKTGPWAALGARDFIHKVDLIIPNECYAALHDKLVLQREQPRYYRVSMRLKQILEGDFFTEYIQKRDVLMISGGTIPCDNVFTLRKSILTLHLDEETYERAGIAGAPHRIQTGLGSKPSWTVSYDLGNLSTLHGRKGFDRLMHACDAVLNQPVTWLFCNIDKSSPSPDPLDKHAPLARVASPALSETIDALPLSLEASLAALAHRDRQYLAETATSLYEWLSLMRLQSPRIVAGDTIDPYLSRYTLPDKMGDPMHVRKLSWRGLLSASWLCDILAGILTTGSPRQWFSLSATSFSQTVLGGGAEVTLFRPPDSSGEFVMWEAQN